MRGGACWNRKGRAHRAPPGLPDPRAASDGEARISQAWREDGADPGGGCPRRPALPPLPFPNPPSRAPPALLPAPRRPPGPRPRQPLLQAPCAGGGTARALSPRCRPPRIPPPFHQRGRPPTGFPAGCEVSAPPRRRGAGPLPGRRSPRGDPGPLPGLRPPPTPLPHLPGPRVWDPGPAPPPLVPAPAPLPHPDVRARDPGLRPSPGPRRPPGPARPGAERPLAPSGRCPLPAGLRAEPYFGRWRCGPRQPCPEGRLFWAGPAEQLWPQGFPAGCAPGTEGTLGQGSPPSPPSSQAAPSSLPFLARPGSSPRPGTFSGARSPTECPGPVATAHPLPAPHAAAATTYASPVSAPTSRSG